LTLVDEANVESLGFIGAMGVPPPVIKLNNTDSVFSEPVGEEAVIGEEAVVGEGFLARLCPIHFVDGLGFVIDGHDLLD